MTDRMMLRSPARSRAPRALAIALAAGAALVAPLAMATPALAHSSLISTTPEADTETGTSTVDALPAEVSLTFSDDLIAPQEAGDGTTDIAVYDETCEDAGLLVADPGRADTRDCRDYADGDPVVDGPTVSQAVDVQGAPAGAYTVVWRVLYNDGHADSQMFTFQAENAAGGEAEPTETASAEPSEPAQTEAAADAGDAPTSEPSETAAAPADDADGGLSTPVVIGIIAGVVVLALIALVITMIARSRRSSDDGSAVE